MKKIKTICIIGGGTAGASAAILFQTHLGPKGIKVVQIDDTATGPIGVGEATVGHINAFLKLCQINAFEIMFAKADATVKYAVRLKDFYKKNHSYFTPVASRSLDFTVNEKYNFSNEDFWLSFAPLYFAEYGKSPFVLNNEEYTTWPEYAWNLDAIKLAKEFGRLAKERGCEFINDVISDVQYNKFNEITGLILKDKGYVEYDFYIDCSGFHKILSKALNIDEITYTDLIPNNTALATQTTYINKDVELPYLSSVECMGMDAGWRWSIGQQSRFGTGYVYASDFIKETDAVDEFIKSYDYRFNENHIRKINFYTHQSKQHAGANWVLAGLSAGFVEPLESTSIFLTHSALVSTLNLLMNSAPANENEMVKWDPWTISHSWNIADSNKSEYEWDLQKAATLTSHVNKMFETTIKYILCHYTWSSRTDTEYWRSYKDKKAQSMIWAKEYLNDWGSHNIFGSWSFALLSIGNECWNELSEGKIDTYLWNNLRFQQMIRDKQIMFDELSKKISVQEDINMQIWELGKYLRRKSEYQKHVNKSLPLLDQHKFLEYYRDKISKNEINENKFFYRDII